MGEEDPREGEGAREAGGRSQDDGDPAQGALRERDSGREAVPGSAEDVRRPRVGIRLPGEENLRPGGGLAGAFHRDRTSGLGGRGGPASARRQDEEVRGAVQGRQDEGSSRGIERGGHPPAEGKSRFPGTEAPRDADEPPSRDQTFERGEPQPPRESQGDRGARVGPAVEVPRVGEQDAGGTRARHAGHGSRGATRGMGTPTTGTRGGSQAADLSEGEGDENAESRREGPHHNP